VSFALLRKKSSCGAQAASLPAGKAARAPLGQKMKLSHTRTLLFAILLLVTIALACGKATPLPPLLFTPAELPDAQVGRPYEVTISISGNVTPVFQADVIEGALPEGLALDNHDIETSSATILSGTPVKAGEYVFTIKVWCYGTNATGQSSVYQYTLTVQ
jgi:hypothetical protein